MDKESFNYLFSKMTMECKFPKSKRNIISYDSNGKVVPFKKYKPTPKTFKE